MEDKRETLSFLVDELQTLRKGEGFVAQRLFTDNVQRNYLTFLQIMGGEEQGFAKIKQRFLSSLDALEDKKQAEILLAAFGLLSGYENLSTLKARRQKYSHEKAHVKTDTLNAREKAAIETLAPLLLNNYYAGAPLTYTLPHGGLLMRRLDVETLEIDGSFVSHEQTREIISLVDAPAGKTGGFAYHSRSKTKIEALSGLEKVMTEYTETGSMHTLKFSEPLRKWREMSFSFRETMLSDDDETEAIDGNVFAGQSFETPTLTYYQAVIFKGKIPKRIWYYKNLSDIERPGSPHAKNLLKFTRENDSVRVEVTLHNLYGGLRSGVAWRW